MQPMIRTLRAAEEGLQLVDRARKSRGWTRTTTLRWWEEAHTTQATLRRFWRRIAIERETFIDICRAVGITNWEAIADLSDEAGMGDRPKRVFISYSHEDLDVTLARHFYTTITEAGHRAFMAGESIRLGENWAQRIEAELTRCDYLLLLLSKQSATSEMVTEEVRRAIELQNSSDTGKPIILPIRIHFPTSFLLNYDLHGYLGPIQHREWNSHDDTPTITQEILELLTTYHDWDSETNEETTPSTASALTRPLLKHPVPSAPPELPLPHGRLNPSSHFYIERFPIEPRCFETIRQPGALIRIKAPRQMGKTSLMARILNQVKTEYHVVPLSLQLANHSIFKDLDQFLRWFCAMVGRRLQLPNQLQEHWDEIFGSKDNCSAYFEDYLLEKIPYALVLGLDEVDCVFQYPEVAADFLGLLRAWHEESKNREIWKKLRLVIVHSTEVYVPMDINQSPFNVGLPIELPEFSPDQVQLLAERHRLHWDIGQTDALMEMVGGHPYLVRLALYHIAHQDITLEHLLRTAPTEAGLYGDHLRRHLFILQQQPGLLAAMQTVVSSVEPTRLEAMTAFKLFSMGLVHLQGNDVVPRSELYRQYFYDRLSNI